MIPGVIFCAWGTLDLVDKSLAPWIELRRQGKCKICAVSVRFAGFEGDDDGTREYLRGALECGDIDHLVDSPDNILETTARGMALTYLKDQGVTHVWQVDSDEWYEIDQINRIIEWVKANEFIVWHRLSLRNYVFDEKTYLADPFTPPRIHAIDSRSSCIAEQFYEDNAIMYRGTITNQLFPDKAFASDTIPESVAAIRHLSWPNSLRSKKKCEYQKARWGNACSFIWDDSQGGLIFNPALPRPRIIHE
jgi:hypothetical protein